MYWQCHLACSTYQSSVIIKTSLVVLYSILMTSGMDFMVMSSERVRSIAGWVPNAMIMQEQWYF